MQPTRVQYERTFLNLFGASERILWQLTNNKIRDGFGRTDPMDKILNQLIDDGAVYENSLGQRQVSLWCQRMAMDRLEETVGKEKDKLGRPRMKVKKKDA